MLGEGTDSYILLKCTGKIIVKAVVCTSSVDYKEMLISKNVRD